MPEKYFDYMYIMIKIHFSSFFFPLQGNGFGFLDCISVDRIKSAFSAGEM